MALATTAILAVATAGLFHAGVVTDRIHMPEVELLNAQLAKIGAETTPPDTLIVGDSSAGNGIDARVWAELSGRPAVNLALTGAFGYQGSLNMVRRQVARFKPRRVVIVQTIATATEPPALSGHIRSSPDLWTAYMTPQEILGGLAVTMADYLNLFTITQAIKSMRGGSPAYFVNDYIAQSAPKTEAERNPKSGEPKMVLQPEAVAFLARFAAYCREHDLDCIYAHGPNYKPTCDRERAYIDALSRQIRSTGLALAESTPVCLPADKLGDTNDHVLPAFKAETTRAYFERIQAARAPAAVADRP